MLPLGSRMAAKQHVISLVEFAEAMLGADDGLAQRVGRFEGRFGQVDGATLAVLAQAAYFCWFECEYRSDLLSICRAIGTGLPTSMYHCVQVTPRRWFELNAYVVGVQRWLGVDHPLPIGVDCTVIERIGRWLGERDVAKEALAKLYLCQLMDHLVLRASFSVLGGDASLEVAEYADYSPWYLRPDGSRYTTGRDQDAPSKDAQDDAFIEGCVHQVREAMHDAPEDAEELIAEIRKPTQPPCMHRFQRYQDIMIASIGARKWRGNLPPRDGSKAGWVAFWGEAEAALRAWLDGVAPKGQIAVELHDVLGAPTERKRAIVRDFLLAEKTSTAGYYWLKDKAHEVGAIAGSVLLTPRGSAK